MNTDRDNFHDWARDKPETQFSAFDKMDARPRPVPGVRWGRIGFFIVLAIALVAGFKYFAGL